jgi:hypothetical protein
MQPAPMPSKLLVQPTDEMLVELAGHGGEEPFEELFHRYAGAVYEYTYLLTGRQSQAESILVKSFLRFYNRLRWFDYRRRVLPHLLRDALALAEKAVSKPIFEGIRASETPAPFLQSRSFEDRTLLILAKRFALRIGEIAWIVRKSSTWVVGKLRDSDASEDVKEWMVPEIPAVDYRALLRSNIHRLKHGKRKRVIGALGLSLAGLVLGSLIYWRGSLSPGTRNFLPEAMDPVLNQNLLIDRRVFATPPESWAQDSLVILPRHGKVLALEYDLSGPPGTCGVEYILREIDLSSFGSLSFWAASQDGIPARIRVTVKKGDKIVFEKKVEGLNAQGRRFGIPLAFARPTPADRLVFAVEESHADKASRNGMLFIDAITWGELSKKS